MKNIALCILLMISIYAAAQEAPEEGVVVMKNPRSREACAERIVKMSEPSFPTSLRAHHALREAACSVRVMFALTSEGKAEDIQSLVTEDRCEVFRGSAERVIRSSLFTSSEESQDCQRVITYKFDEEKDSDSIREP